MHSNTITVLNLLLILLPGKYLYYSNLISILYIPVIICSSLTDLYKIAMQRSETILEEKLTNLIRSSVPSGIDAALPKIAEYETFKQSPESNFIHDGNGKLHFRQFRRLNLNTVRFFLLNRI
ncbi:hypothetical protein PRIPAC_80334 [Pristionchus pacificus]|uniref:Uncharacterized protein n=1 Tax=Pristionchus pacificus TaxID=54126 RepID=A0A2A6CMG0_PRIPA|nr:hypothetical protein PRIPAC_80334 [Pristionchus pacificus]|eukprot:PDM79280.1 hypothetical protein PRIPAC_31859 [Pristionchus pacificus]